MNVNVNIARRFKGSMLGVLIGLAVFAGLELTLGDGIDSTSIKNMLIAGAFCGIPGLFVGGCIHGTSDWAWGDIVFHFTGTNRISSEF